MDYRFVPSATVLPLRANFSAGLSVQSVLPENGSFGFLTKLNTIRSSQCRAYSHSASFKICLFCKNQGGIYPSLVRNYFTFNLEKLQQTLLFRVILSNSCYCDRAGQFTYKHFILSFIPALKNWVFSISIRTYRIMFPITPRRQPEMPNRYPLGGRVRWGCYAATYSRLIAMPLLMQLQTVHLAGMVPVESVSSIGATLH